MTLAVTMGICFGLEERESRVLRVMEMLRASGEKYHEIGLPAGLIANFISGASVAIESPPPERDGIPVHVEVKIVDLLKKAT
jgi:hypothetical protein